MNKKIMIGLVETVESVECSKCGTLHMSDSDDFFVVYGNITIGKTGGVVGNNLDDKGKVYRSSIYCRHKDCLHNVLKQLT